MALAANYVLFLSLFFGLSIPATSQDCSLPDNSTINTNLQSLLIAVGGEGSTLVTTLLDHHFTCLAFGSSRDQYRYVSVAVRYTKNTESGNFTAQFPLRCTSGNFGGVGELDQSPPANVFDISTRRDCFICTTVNSQPGFTIDTAADCACKLVILFFIDLPAVLVYFMLLFAYMFTASCTVCDSSCLMMGQGACNDPSSPTDCCPFYNTDNSCTTSCDTNFIATPSTNYTCGEQYKF